MSSESKNQCVVFVRDPKDNEGEEKHQVTTANLALASAEPASEPADGEISVRLTFVSVDPYMRGKMNVGAKSYTDAFVPGKPMAGGVTAVVTKSKFEGLAEGDAVTGFLPWVLEQTVPGGQLRKLDAATLAKISPSAFLGALGMPGLSAYFPITRIAEPKEGEVAWVNGAAGAVGNVAGQILKLMGCRVIGSAGSDEKVAVLKRMGFDEAFNYKTTDGRAAIKAFAPDGLDIVWDNVGGPDLDLALEMCRTKGRIVCCGAISQYNKGSDEKYGLKNSAYIIGKSLRVQGFIVTNWAKEFGEGIAALGGWAAEGKLRWEETVVEGFEKIPEAFVGLFSGRNTGKMVVKV